MVANELAQLAERLAEAIGSAILGQIAPEQGGEQLARMGAPGDGKIDQQGGRLAPAELQRLVTEQDAGRAEEAEAQSPAPCRLATARIRPPLGITTEIGRA